MKRTAVFLALALAGVALLSVVLLLRPRTPVDVPPPVHPLLPPSSTVPVIPLRPPPSTEKAEPEDPLLRRWRSSIRSRTAPEVTQLQSTFLTRENDYREPLVALSKEDEDPRVRAFTVAVLGRMKQPPPEAYFLERTGDAHEYPRTSAVQALEKTGTAACLGALDRLAAGDPAEAVRGAAARAAKAVRSR